MELARVGGLEDDSQRMRLWRAWNSEAPLRAGRALVMGSCALLFLSAAGTVEAIYTLTASYILLGVACLVALPWVVDGWRTAPRVITWSAAAVLATYAFATLLGDPEVLGSQDRAGGYRNVAYLADLVLGLSSLGLIMGLGRRGGGLLPVILALVAGAVAGGLYGLYQWPAQHFGWPFEDVNNTLDSSGLTEGGDQGAALLGWERIRGTFLEPHFFGVYLASLLPLTVVLASWLRGRRRMALAIGALGLLLALVLTASVPAWAALALSGSATATLIAIGRGSVGVSALLGAATVLACALGLLVFSYPAALASVTGRSETQLALTVDFRTGEWQRALEIWGARPVLGYGPGQSSVRMAATPTSDEVAPKARVLRSAQGLWAASLIDAGLLGFGAWLCFLIAVVFVGARALLRAPRAFGAGVFTAAGVSIISANFAGDRLDLRVWLLLGLLVAIAGGRGGLETRSASGQPREKTVAAR